MMADKHFKGCHDGLRLVSQRVIAAVAIGENLRSIGEFYPLGRLQAVDFPRREGAGLYVKGIQPGEVDWPTPSTASGSTVSLSTNPI